MDGQSEGSNMVPIIFEPELKQIKILENEA